MTAGVPLAAATSTLIVALTTYGVATTLKSLRRCVVHHGCQVVYHIISGGEGDILRPFLLVCFYRSQTVGILRLSAFPPILAPQSTLTCFARETVTRTNTTWLSIEKMVKIYST